MNVVRFLLYSAVLSGLAASPVLAQVRERVPVPATERSRERILFPSEGVQAYSYFSANRGKMGITVSIRPEATDSIGALVDAVSPGSPAFKAGIQSGDVITRLNGKSLVVLAREERKTSPGIVIVEITSTLSAGDTARLEYRRGPARYSSAIVLEPANEFTFQRRIGPGEDRFEHFLREDWPGDQPRMDGTVLTGPGPGGMVLPDRTPAALELAPVNPELGQYFGVTTGVLVVSAPAGSSLSLKSGDVVMAVDGRQVSSPNQMFRILRSYERGEQFRFDIMRMKRRETVTGSLDR